MIKLTQTTMTPTEWAEVEDNPIQRDTEEHAKKARNKHLKKASPVHARVSAAQLPNGDVYKLDGHTRSFLWQDGSLAAPAYLFVDMYMVDNMSEVEDLYKQFDSADAAETAMDKLRGAFRLHGMKPESGLVLFGGTTSALTLIVGKNRSINVYNAITPWVETLIGIDAKGYSAAEFPASVYAAMLLTVRVYGDEAFDFWGAYARDEGRKEGKVRCPVQALSDLIHDRRKEKRLGGRENMAEIASKAISCFEMHRSGGSYTVGVKSTDLRAYIDKKLPSLQEAAA